MNRITLHRISLALALSAAIGTVMAADGAPDLSKVNGSLVAEAGRTYGDIDTVNGSITVESKAVARTVETVNGSIVIDAFATVQDVGTVNGKIVLRNGASARNVEIVNGAIVGVSNLRVQKSVEAVNGSIELGAHSSIGSQVKTVNGNITVGDGTVIGGNVTVKKPSNWGMSWGKPKIPRVVLGPNSTVKGNLVFEREVELYVHSTAKYGKIVYLEAEAGKAEALKPIVFTGKEPDFK